MMAIYTVRGGKTRQHWRQTVLVWLQVIETVNSQIFTVLHGSLVRRPNEREFLFFSGGMECGLSREGLVHFVPRYFISMHYLIYNNNNHFTTYRTHVLGKMYSLGNQTVMSQFFFFIYKFRTKNKTFTNWIIYMFWILLTGLITWHKLN